MWKQDSDEKSDELPSKVTLNSKSVCICPYFSVCLDFNSGFFYN